MPETSSASSSPSSCVSFSSFDEAVPAVMTPHAGSPTDSPIKLLCSYGGKILPRRHDGKLRYVGGHTRVLTVHRPVRFHGLYRKLRELCGWDAVTVRCQLPTEDMDALVTASGDDDLAGVLDEYDAAAARQDPTQQPLRVRVFLYPPAAAAAAGARTRTPRSPLTPPLMATGCRRRPAGQFFLHATRAASPHAGRFILVTPLAPVVSLTRPQLLCQKCQ